MRGVRALAALAVIAFFSFAAGAQEAAVSRFGFDFPLRIGSLTRGEVTDFEKTSQGLGYGIRYRASGARVDLFVYDLGKRSISPETSSSDQKEEFANAVRDVHRAREKGFYRSVKDGREFESPAKNPVFRCKTFQIDRGEGRLEDSALCLGAQNDKFFKVRIAFAPPGPNFQDRADKLLREIARAVKFQ